MFWSKFEMFRRPVQWWKNYTNCTIWASWPGICFVGVEGKSFYGKFSTFPFNRCKGILQTEHFKNSHVLKPLRNMDEADEWRL